jgi:hypothetical protein
MITHTSSPGPGKVKNHLGLPMVGTRIPNV